MTDIYVGGLPKAGATEKFRAMAELDGNPDYLTLGEALSFYRAQHLTGGLQPTNQDEFVEQKAREAVAIADVLSRSKINIYIDGREQSVSAWRIKSKMACYRGGCSNIETYYAEDKQADLDQDGWLSVSEMAVAKYNSNPSLTAPELKSAIKREFLQRLFAENRFQANRHSNSLLWPAVFTMGFSAALGGIMSGWKGSKTCSSGLVPTSVVLTGAIRFAVLGSVVALAIFAPVIRYLDAVTPEKSRPKLDYPSKLK